MVAILKKRQTRGISSKNKKITSEWPLGSPVWACMSEREKLPNILHYNVNFLSLSNRRF